MARIPSPQGDVTFVRLEQWDARKGEWVVMHAGVNLLHPARYVERLAGNGKIGRAIEVDTGQTWGPQRQPKAHPRCAYCGSLHPTPHDGTCLI